MAFAKDETSSKIAVIPFLETRTAKRCGFTSNNVLLEDVQAERE